MNRLRKMRTRFELVVSKSGNDVIPLTARTHTYFLIVYTFISPQFTEYLKEITFRFAALKFISHF